MIYENSNREKLNRIRSEIIKTRRKFSIFMWVIRAVVLWVIISEVIDPIEPGIFGIIDPIPYMAPFLMIWIEYRHWISRKDTTKIIASIDNILTVPDEILDTTYPEFMEFIIGDLEKHFVRK